MKYYHTPLWPSGDIKDQSNIINKTEILATIVLYIWKKQIWRYEAFKTI
jgi:hypothetical protein